jgi:hypothetical protein
VRGIYPSVAQATLLTESAQSALFGFPRSDA